jgi:hypothetical protein
MLDRYRGWSDVVIATALIVAGSAALVARLDLSYLPELSKLVQWWPMLLIVLGAVLWRLEHTSRRSQPARTQEVRYGK